MQNTLSADERFQQLGLVLPPAPKPLGVYKPFLIVDKFVYVSGHGTVKDDGSLIIGRIGTDLTMEEGKIAARQVGLAILSTLKQNLGSLNKISRVIKVLGMVNATPDFNETPKVINGFSDLFVEIYGAERGRGARSAVGMVMLPNQIAVEVEMVLQLRA